MKKIFVITVAAISFVFTSCESDDKNIFLELERAHAVAMHINNEEISLSGSSFAAEVDAFKVVQYNIKVFQQSVNDTLNFATYTSFPFDLTISENDIATALGINPSEIVAGNSFIFLGESIAEDGTVYTIANFAIGLGSQLVSSPNMNFSSKAYRFTVNIVE